MAAVSLKQCEAVGQISHRRTLSWLETLIAESLRPVLRQHQSPSKVFLLDVFGSQYLKDIPYCATLSKPFFQTSVTSQAFVAWSLHDKKADTAFPPTAQAFVSGACDMSD